MAYENRDYTHLTESEKKNINLIAKAIRNKAYGIDVRESIALAIELMLDIFSKENNDAYAEVVKARDEFGSLDERLDDIVADLNNLSVSQINKNLGKIDQTYLTDELIAQIAGTAEINAVPADNSLTSSKYVDGSITSSKLDSKFLARTPVNNADLNTISTHGSTYVSGNLVNGPAGETDGNVFVFGNNPGGWNTQIFRPRIGNRTWIRGIRQDLGVASGATAWSKILYDAGANVQLTDKPIITLVDDDGTTDFINLFKPVLDELSIKATIACIPNQVGTVGRMTLDELKTLKNEGHDIVSHTFSHDANLGKTGVANFDTVTFEQYDLDIRKGYEYMITNDFNASTVVYPYGNYPAKHLRKIQMAARKYHMYGINSHANNGMNNDKVINTTYLNRDFIKDSNGIDVYKARIDEIVANNGWYIIGTHANDTAYLTAGFLKQVLQYGQSKGVAILPFSEAIKIKKNIASVGLFQDEGQRYWVGRDGTILN